jgi:predicted dehydrogenase
MAYQGIPNVEFVAVADEEPEGLRRAGERTGAKSLYTDYREMLEKEELDIVSVCPRWVDCHRDMVIACAEAGAHIYCEKPFARTLEEADEMLEACRRNGVKIAVAHVWRRRPDIIAAKELIEKGGIGEIISMHGRGKEDHRGGGEDLIVLGTHVFDLMRFLGGDPLWAFAHVTAKGNDITVEDVIFEGPEGLGPIAGDSIFAYYAFPDGVYATFETHRNQRDPTRRFGLDIYGSEGIIAIRSNGVYRYPYPVPVPDDPEVRWERIGSLEGWNPQQRIVEDLIAAVEEDREPVSSGADGRAALEMILAVYESQRTGGRVRFPMENRSHPLITYKT